MTVAPPEFVKVSVSDLVLPIGTVPKLGLGGLATSEPGAKPIAASGKFSMGLEPLLTRVTLPAALPPVWGANVTLKLELWPAANVSGKLSPLMPKPVPEMEACDMVRLDPPELLRITGKV